MPEYCLIKHRIENVTIDGDDPDRNPDRIPATGTITFEPILQRGDSVTITENGKTTTLTLSPIEANITQGEIWHKGEPGIKIFAGGDDTNPDRIRYKATFSNMQAGGKKIELKPILFEAIPGGELELSVAQPIPGAPYPGYSASIEQALGRISTELSRTLDHIDATAANVISDVRQQNGIPRIEALEALGELSPESPVDGQTANLIGQPGTLTRSAVDSVIGDALLVVAHGDDAYHLRPDTPRRVLWLGTVVPQYRRAGDLVPEVVPIPAPWTPEMLDLVAWYDPTNGYESGTVPQITDRGPLNLHMNIGGTGGISIDTNTLELPAFANAGTAFATSPLLPDGAWDHPVTVYMVASLSTLPSVSSLLDNGPGPSNTRVAIWATVDGVLGLNQGISVNSGRDTVSANTPFLVAVTFSGGADTYAEVEGGLVVGPADAGSNKLGSVRLFANGADERIADAVIGDVVIARNVTPEQHADTVAWLQDKWGLV